MDGLHGEGWMSKDGLHGEGWIAKCTCGGLLLFMSHVAQRDCCGGDKPKSNGQSQAGLFMS
jgi:hypothetical protein